MFWHVWTFISQNKTATFTTLSSFYRITDLVPTDAETVSAGIFDITSSLIKFECPEKRANSRLLFGKVKVGSCVFLTVT